MDILAPPLTDEEIYVYYRDHFPLDLVWELLCQCVGGEHLCKHLDFSIDKPVSRRHSYNNNYSVADTETILIRYLSAATKQDLHKLLLQNSPRSVSIGSLYHVEGALRPQIISQFGSQENHGKPFMIDFDITDFQRDCHCGDLPQVCQLCWERQCAPLIKLLEEACPILFGSGMLVSYSGRRGVHACLPNPNLTYASTHDRASALEFIEGQVSACGPGLFDRYATTSNDHTIRLPFTINTSTGFIDLPCTSSTPFENVRVHVRSLIQLHSNRNNNNKDQQQLQQQQSFADAIQLTQKFLSTQR